MTRASRSLDMAERHDLCSMDFEQHCSDAVLVASTLSAARQLPRWDVQSSVQWAAHLLSPRTSHADAGGALGAAWCVHAADPSRCPGDGCRSNRNRVLTGCCTQHRGNLPAHGCCAAWELPQERLLHSCRCITVTGSQHMDAALHPEAAP